MAEDRKRPNFVKPKSRVAHHEVSTPPPATKEKPAERATRNRKKRGRRKPYKISLLLKEIDYDLLTQYAELEDESMTKLIEKYLNKNGFFEMIQKELRDA